MDLSEKALWQAVLKRDRSYNGICFYGVMTTYIYCRFHCPSKKPLVENTRFFFPRKGQKKLDLDRANAVVRTKQRSH